MATPRIKWPTVLDTAKTIVDGYNADGTMVTLRQLFYRLVAAGLIVNDDGPYKTLSAKTAEARRDGWFPDLIDTTRAVQQATYFSDPHHAMRSLIASYRLDRTEGQEQQIYFGVEKMTLVAQVYSWFGDLGIPIVPLRGYSSQSFADVIKRLVDDDGRKSLLIYAGDFDPSGEDIGRDFQARTDCWDDQVRIAVLPEHIATFGLAVNAGKPKDSRTKSFIAQHRDLHHDHGMASGIPIQVEAEALDPRDLRQMFADELAVHWNTAPYDVMLAQEDTDKAELRELLRRVTRRI